MFNEVILIGKLANKPVIKSTTNGIKMATAIIEVERPYRNNLGIREIDHVHCVLWKSLAEMVNDCCDIGSFVGIKGRIQSRSYENESNQSISTMEVKVENVCFVEKYMIDHSF